MSEVARLVELAARAKAKVKASARGWSMVTAEEIVALAFIADVFLEDAALVAPSPARPIKGEPDVISRL
jgi:hypothetical protein